MNWKEKIADKWWRVKVAEQAVQVEKDVRRQHITVNAIKNAYRIVGNKEPDDLPQHLEEPMSVNVGDNTNYYAPKKNMLEGIPGMLVGGVTAAALMYGYMNAKPQDAKIKTNTNTIQEKYEFSLGFPDGVKND